MSIDWFDVDAQGVLSFVRRVREPFSRERLHTEIVGESRTHQSHRESCDVNWIISRYERTGELPRVKRDGVYADVSALGGDLMEQAIRAQDVIITSEQFLVQRAAEKAAQEAAAKAAPPPAAVS
jgi:hypothetical protein